MQRITAPELHGVARPPRHADLLEPSAGMREEVERPLAIPGARLVEIDDRPQPLRALLLQARMTTRS